MATNNHLKNKVKCTNTSRSFGKTCSEIMITVCEIFLTDYVAYRTDNITQNNIYKPIYNFCGI